MSAFVLEKPVKSSAAGNYLGYSLQQLRACYHLLTADDEDYVSLEYVDDVAVHRADGSLLLEQSKSALTGNPIRDRAEDLWKTFKNWVVLCEKHGVDPDTTTFRLYVSPIKPGALAREMDFAGKAKARTALNRIQKLGADPNFSPCTPHIQHFLAADETLCLMIIERFKLEVDNEPTKRILEFARVLAPDAAAEVAAACVGMAIDRFDKLIRQKKPAVVSCKAFRRAVNTFASRSNLQNLIATPIPSTSMVSDLFGQSPLFVRQLLAVDFKRDMLMSAVSDYLRTNADKTFWAEEGRVLDTSLAEFDDQLVRRHGIVRDEIEDVQSEHSEVVRGRNLYRRCAESSLNLEGSSLPPHFVPGELNHLAQVRRLGWHPFYETLFPEDGT